MQVVSLQPLLQETVGRDILKLLQRVDLQRDNSLTLIRETSVGCAFSLAPPSHSANLRQFILDSKFILRIDISNEFSQRRLGLKDNRLVETVNFEMLKLGQAGASVSAQPRS